MSVNQFDMRLRLVFHLPFIAVTALVATAVAEEQGGREWGQANPLTANRAVVSGSELPAASPERPQEVPIDEPVDGLVQESASREIPRKAATDDQSAVISGSAGKKTTLLSILWPLAIVLGLLGFGVVAAKRWLAGTSLKTGNGLRILQRTYLTQKQWLAVVECGNKALLIAVCPDRVEALYCIDDAEEITRLASSANSPNSKVKQNPFAFQLERETGRMSREEPVLEPERGSKLREKPDARSQIQSMMNRMNSLRDSQTAEKS